MTSPFFDFEQDFVDGLRCIPMVVRHRLDTCGVKLKLEHWNKFSPSDRQGLVTAPCGSPAEIEQYRQRLQAMVTQYSGAPAKEISPEPDWQNCAAIPPAVVAKFDDQQIPLSLEQWSNLSELQRFALIKLSRSSHENNNFMPAVKEFGLAE